MAEPTVRETRTAFLVTVDTEADNEWTPGGPVTFRNLQALPDFQEMCDRHGVRPTYLVTYDVATHGEGYRILRDLLAGGNCEIGAHSHAWATPPFHPPQDGSGMLRPYLFEYPRDAQFMKLSVLTDVLEQLFQTKMVSHRAGRWGMDPYGIAALYALGYKADSSVTPLISWEDCEGLPGGHGGPSFARAPRQPYYPSDTDIAKPGQTHVLEVPVSVGIISPLTGLEVSRMLAGVFTGWSLATRVVRKGLRTSGLARRVMLSPVHASEREMLQLCRARLARRAPVVNMALHSSELVEGCSPFVGTPQEAARVWSAMERVCAYLATGQQATRLTLGQFAERASASGTTGSSEWGAEIGGEREYGLPGATR